MSVNHSAESGAAIVAKVAPPLSVSIATIYGISVSEILLWATLIYTLMMIGHKAWQIWRDVTRPSAPAAVSSGADECR